ncbi:alpha/beta hydrolase [Psychrobacter sp. P11G5]|uniref:alpha/beta hydrolase n=1 Tax=Psychrobacter sp. P11G5 TaxID=1699624 RepID=UPI00078CD98F|nr:alpha/beta hydrolase [Psychrobacter sp. P11G5]AMN68645.1 lipase [Psychrobacter sp. P11G5]
MPVLPIPSVNVLVSKIANTIKALRSRASSDASERSPSKGSSAKGSKLLINHLNNSLSSDIHHSKASYQKHAFHYVLKGLGYLPTPLLERLNTSLQGSNTKQYPHADAHLRLIIALNNKLKRPLRIDKLTTLRHKFAADAVAMQAPNVWQQLDNDLKLPIKDNAEINAKNNAKTSTQRKAETGATVRWQDEIIANADGDDMTVRCYQQHGQSVDETNRDKTVMLFFHGGGFCIGDLDTHHEFCHAVCRQTGWPVVSVDYRLAPEYAAPTALRDCLAAYEWLAEHCHTLGALPSRIVLSGDSAGDCLAILVAQQITAPDATQWLNLELDEKDMINKLQDLPSPLAQLPLYPVTDIETNYPSWALYGKGLLLDYNDVEVFDTAYMQHSTLTGSHPLTSPMHGNNTHMCPSYIVAAELDILRDEALVYADQLQDSRIATKTYTVLGAPHGFIHLMSIHKGIGHETAGIIDKFASFVRQLLTTKSD